jgi:hypothetical protein
VQRSTTFERDGSGHSSAPTHPPPSSASAGLPSLPPAWRAAWPVAAPCRVIDDPSTLPRAHTSSALGSGHSTAPLLHPSALHPLRSQRATFHAHHSPPSAPAAAPPPSLSRARPPLSPGPPRPYNIIWSSHIHWGSPAPFSPFIHSVYISVSEPVPVSRAAIASRALFRAPRVFRSVPRPSS